MNTKQVDEESILRQLLSIESDNAWSDDRYVPGDKVYDIFFSQWGNEYDSKMHILSMQRRGYLEPEGKTGWLLLVTEDELNGQ